MKKKAMRSLLASSLVIAALGLSACGSSSTSASSTTSTTTTTGGPVMTLQLKAPLSSASKNLHSVGTATQYGWNQLVGTSTNYGESIGVEILGNVAYTNGAGPFFGFVTYTWPDGSTIGVRMSGRAVPGAHGTTSFSAPLNVLGGTGRYGAVKGTGLFTGSRSGVVGSPVESTFTLHITNPTN